MPLQGRLRLHMRHEGVVFSALSIGLEAAAIAPHLIAKGRDNAAHLDSSFACDAAIAGALIMSNRSQPGVGFGARYFSHTHRHPAASVRFPGTRFVRPRSGLYASGFDRPA